MRAFAALSSMKNGHWISTMNLLVTSGPECDELNLSIVNSAFLLKQFIEVQQKKS